MRAEISADAGVGAGAGREPVGENTTRRTEKKSPLRGIAAAVIVATGFLVVAAMFWISSRGNNPTNSDYIGYWAAGQQLAHHANPYDVAAVLQLERKEGYAGDQPRLTPSPPVALPLVLPLGFVSARTGLLLWAMGNLGLLALSLRVLWLVHGKPHTLVHLLGFLFAPAVACLQAGQLGIVFLLCMALFLYWIESRPFLAGAAFLPCLLKPHLFVPFALVLLLWVIRKKAFKFGIGVLACLLLNGAITVFFDPHVFADYVRMLRSSTLQDRFTPTLSVALRMLIAWNSEWPRFVLLGGACVWAIWFFWSRRDRWDWQDQGLIVLLVSLMCSPYSWFMDEAVLLPALLTALVRENGRKWLVWPIWIAGGAALIEIFRGVDIKSMDYLWTTPVWLTCYLLATKGTREQGAGTGNWNRARR